MTASLDEPYGLFNPVEWMQDLHFTLRHPSLQASGYHSRPLSYLVGGKFMTSLLAKLSKSKANSRGNSM